MTNDISADLAKMAFPSEVIDDLVSLACEQLGDVTINSRIGTDRLFRGRLSALAQHIVVALTCAQLFVVKEDFAASLAARPFSGGDAQAQRVGYQLLNAALAFGRLPDAEIDDRVFDERAASVRNAI